MLRRKKVSVKIYIGILFFLFLLYQLLQHSLVFLYHDDFGYACLQYGTNMGNGGLNYGLKDILAYLNWHYHNWGGRVLYFFFEIALLRTGGLPLIRAVQSFVIVLIVYETYLIARGKGKDSLLLAFAAVLLWGTMTIAVLREGVYWFTASVLYVWPIAFFLLGVLLRIGTIAVKGRWKRRTAMFFAFFSAGFSQEQVAVMVISFCAADVFFSIWRKGKTEYICLAGALLGGLTEILAPGNFVRASGEDNAAFFALSLFEKLLHNVPRIASLVFGPQNMFLNVAVCITVLLTGIILWRQKKQKRWLAGAGIISVIYPVSYLVSRLEGMLGLWLYVVMFFWAVAAMLWLLSFYLKRGEYLPFSLLLCGICSQAALVVSPALNYRSAVIFELIFHCAALFAVREAICMAAAAARAVRAWAAVGCVLLSAACCLNVMQIGLGYYRNARIHRDNHRILTEAARRYREGETAERITVYKMYDDRYAERMPYTNSYIETWIKGYYELPAETEFVYEESWKRNVD